MSEFFGYLSDILNPHIGNRFYAATERYLEKKFGPNLVWAAKGLFPWVAVQVTHSCSDAPISDDLTFNARMSDVYSISHMLRVTIAAVMAHKKLFRDNQPNFLESFDPCISIDVAVVDIKALGIEGLDFMHFYNLKATNFPPNLFDMVPDFMYFSRTRLAVRNLAILGILSPSVSSTIERTYSIGGLFSKFKIQAAFNAMRISQASITGGPKRCFPFGITEEDVANALHLPEHLAAMREVCARAERNPWAAYMLARAIRKFNDPSTGYATDFLGILHRSSEEENVAERTRGFADIARAIHRVITDEYVEEHAWQAMDFEQAFLRDALALSPRAQPPEMSQALKKELSRLHKKMRRLLSGAKTNNKRSLIRKMAALLASETCSIGEGNAVSEHLPENLKVGPHRQWLDGHSMQGSVEEDHEASLRNALNGQLSRKTLIPVLRTFARWSDLERALIRWLEKVVDEQLPESERQPFLKPRESALHRPIV